MAEATNSFFAQSQNSQKAGPEWCPPFHLLKSHTIKGYDMHLPRAGLLVFLSFPSAHCPLLPIVSFLTCRPPCARCLQSHEGGWRSWRCPAPQTCCCCSAVIIMEHCQTQVHRKLPITSSFYCQPQQLTQVIAHARHRHVRTCMNLQVFIHQWWT